MDDWKVELKRRFDEHVERRSQVHAALRTVLGELNGVVATQLELLDDVNLIWMVTVANQAIQVSSDDITDYQKELDESGTQQEERTIDIHEAIRKLLLRRLKWVH